MDNILLLACSCALIMCFPSVAPANIVRIRHIGPHDPSRGMAASDSKQIMIKVKPSDSLPVGRVMPNMPSSMSESKILHLKPVVLKFHKDRNPNSTVPVDTEKLYNAMQEMGLNKMALLLRQIHLGEELLKSGPLTLFSPTDEAFSLAPRGFVQNLLQDGNQENLWNILVHHVIRGHMQAEDVRNDFTMPTPHHTGAPLRFNIYAGGQVVTVNGAQFLYNVRDVDGVLIQAIDRVLYPLAETSLIEKLRNEFHEMHSMLLKAGLSDQLSSGTFTVFSPKDEAFAVLPPEATDTLLGNSTLLRKVVLNHVVPGTYFTAALGNGFSAKPLGGNILLFTSRRGMILVNGVPVMEPDQITTNGVVHGINRVLVPEDLIQQCKCMQRYPLMPATLRPPPTASGVKDGADGTTLSDSDPDNGIPFGTRIKTASTGILLPESTAATQGPDQDDETPPGWPETTDTPRPLLGMLSDPIRLPGGRRATFSTSNNLFRNSVFISRIRYPGAAGMTILLPTDRAFRRLPPVAMDQLRNDPSRLKSTLGMHILEGRIDPNALISGVPLRTVGGRTLMVNVLPQRKGLIIGGVPILAVRSGTNGAVFVIDRMVQPSQAIGIDQIVKVSAPTTPADDDELSIWRGIIDDVPDLKNALKSRDRFYTMFAPTNSAFSHLPPDHLKRLLEEEQLKRDLIRSHVMTGALSRNLLNPDLVAPSLQGNKLRFHRIAGAFEVNSVPVYRRPIVTSNGVVFIVEKLLFSPITSRSLEPPEEKPTESTPQSLEEIALRYNATTFLKWIHASGLRDTIKAHAPCALILPSNAAIDRMSPTLRMIAVTNRRALQRLVKYHVFTTPRVWPSFEANEWTLPTLLPNIPLRINVYKNNTLLTFSGCPVEEMMRSKDRIDVAIVNNTMSPPVGDLDLTMSKSPLLRNFTKIVKVSGLDLKGKNGPFTVFAPTKCVFESMAPELYHELITNPDAARDFVQRHIVKGTTYTKGMYDGLKLDSLAGNPISITIPPDCIHVNEARMRYGDLGATNGVIHILDRVL